MYLIKFKSSLDCGPHGAIGIRAFDKRSFSLEARMYIIKIFIGFLVTGLLALLLCFAKHL